MPEWKRHLKIWHVELSMCLTVMSASSGAYTIYCMYDLHMYNSESFSCNLHSASVEKNEAEDDFVEKNIKVILKLWNILVIKREIES